MRYEWVIYLRIIILNDICLPGLILNYKAPIYDYYYDPNLMDM